MKAPKSYKVRHDVIWFLTKKRTEQSLRELSDSHNRFSIKEIAKAINTKEEYVDEQLNFLWFKKYVYDIKVDGETKFMISP